jgi:hypothetical protein
MECENENDNSSQTEKIYNRKGLKSTKAVPSIAQLIKEGDSLLEKDTTPKPPRVTTKSKKTTPSTNPYILAREKVLNSFDTWKKNEILTMERTNNKNNRWYEDFVSRVSYEGDQLSQ